MRGSLRPAQLFVLGLQRIQQPAGAGAPDTGVEEAAASQTEALRILRTNRRQVPLRVGAGRRLQAAGALQIHALLPSSNHRFTSTL